MKKPLLPPVPSPRPPAGRPVAPHVQAALARAAQPSVSHPPQVRPPVQAEHVRAMIQRPAVQAKPAAPPAPPRLAPPPLPSPRGAQVIQRARLDPPLDLPPSQIDKPPRLNSELKHEQLGYIIGDAPVRTEANQVVAVVRIKVANQYEVFSEVITDTETPEAPYSLGSPHTHEDEFIKLYYSRNDAEASLLPKAEAICANNAYPVDGEWHHMVTLIGPYGPCDGCRMRMELFRKRWLDLAREPQRKNGIRMRLTLSYYYYVPSDRVTTGTRSVDKTDFQSIRNIKKLPFREFKTTYGVREVETSTAGFFETNYYSEKKSRDVKATIYWYKVSAQNY